MKIRSIDRNVVTLERGSRMSFVCFSSDADAIGYVVKNAILSKREKNG